jgi:hypothetical protein
LLLFFFFIIIHFRSPYFVRADEMVADPEGAADRKEQH